MAGFLSNVVILFSLTFGSICPFTEGIVATLDVQVQGNNVVKSGVRQYTAYGSYSWNISINCALISGLLQPEEVFILQNRQIIQYLTIKDSNSFATIWSKRFPTKSTRTNNVLEKYTCRALFNKSYALAVSERRVRTTIDIEVEVKFVREVPGISSSVGSIVYAGEQISIACGNRYTTCEFRPELSSTSMTHVPSNGQSTVTCDWEGYYYYNYYSGYQKCETRQLNLDIINQLQLSLTPFNFTKDGTTLKFNCTSFPPRLMRWTIITANGDMLDFSSFDVIKVSINTTITQRPGETILNIKEASPGGNDILAVRCSTYDTLAQVDVTSHRVITEDNDVKTTVTYKPKTTAEKEAYQTTEVQSVKMATGSHNDCNESVNSVAQSPKFQSTTETTYAIFIAITVTMTSIVSILIVVLIILCRKLKLATFHHAPPTSRDTGCSMESPSATELHPNPVYMSYSETNDVSNPNDEEQNDTCTYINI
ncbi:uncharacterized protein [Apostichopus japonicus]|uniref:uncharacterized protein n=1 Tax=Stichopus japonicus TaxID=307972 RepID=UPI003AB4CFBE